MDCSVEDLFPIFTPDTSIEEILSKLKHGLIQLNKPNTHSTLTQPLASLIISNLSNLIQNIGTHKDVIILCFLSIQKILNLISLSTNEFLNNFILISEHFGFVRTKELSNNLSPPTLHLSSPRTSNLFIKLIFLREFITGKDPTILTFLFSPSFENSNIYLFFFKQLQSLSFDQNFPTYIRIYCHAFIQWLDTTMLFFKHIPYDSNVNNDVFSSKQELFSFIFNFVWKFIEEPLSGVSENAKIILQKYFRLFSKFSSWSKQDATAFYQNFLNDTLDIPWTSKARYILLHGISEHLSSETIMTTHNQLPYELTRCLSTTNLYSSASDLYKSLIHGISVEKWVEVWLAHFMRSLLSSDQDERHHLTQYWLPTTLKLIPYSSQIILCSVLNIARSSKFSHLKYLTPLYIGHTDTCINNLTSNDSSILHAAILWIKYTVVLEQFKLSECCIGIIREGLSCGDEFVRIESLYVLLATAFDSSQLWRLELIHEFLPLNLNPSSTPSRQKLSAILSKSITCIQCMLIDGMPCDNLVESNANFSIKFQGFVKILCFLKSKSMQCLWPDSPSQKVTLGLSIYQSLLDSFVSPIETRKSNSKSKRSKLRLYSTLCSLGFELLTLSELVPVCLCLTSDYFEIRELSFHIISPHLTLEPVSAAVNIVFPDGIAVRGKCLLKSSRVYDGETGAMLLKLHLRSEIDNCRDINPDNHLYLLCLELLSELSRQFMSARDNILDAAHHAPLFSTITTINSIINLPSNMKQKEIDWQGFLSDLISLLVEITTFSLSILGDSNINNEDVLAPSFADMGVAIESAVLATQSNEYTNLASSHTDCSSISYQFVMNCVWLTLREINTLMGTLSALPIINSSQVINNMLVLTPQLVEKIGGILMTILTKCRHIGALLSSQTAFIKFCINISCSAVSSVSSLPAKWLHDILSIITSQDKKSSISRQGAGLPFCVLSILTSESKRSHKPLLNLALRPLFLHACSTEEIRLQGMHDLVAVRCTNVLRALFRDSNVGNECVLSFGEKGLSLAVTSMRSSIWSVRNAGMMLFGALAVKMLGQRRLSEENSELNSITVKQFFIRFPSARSLLLSQLQSSPDCVSTNLHAAVYPVLLLLSKLCPSPHYAFPEKLDYIRTLQGYIQSPVHSVRCKASQALIALLYKPNMDALIIHLINKIPSSYSQCISYNALHGQLVLLSEIMKVAYATYSTVRTDTLLDMYKRVLSKYWLLAGKVLPLSINKVYFNVLRILIDRILVDNNFIEINSDVFNILKQHSYTDPSSVDLIVSIIEYFLSWLDQTDEIFQEACYKFSAEFVNSMEPLSDSLIYLTKSLLKHTNSLQLFKHVKNSFLESIKCFIQSASSPLIPYDSLSFLLEVLAQMLDITPPSMVPVIPLNSLIGTFLSIHVSTASLAVQLSSMQLSGIILTWKLVHQEVAIEQEEEVKLFWLQLVRKHSKPDLSEDSRMACVISLVRIFTQIQCTHTILVECVDVTILLLQDELAEVRNALSDGLANLLSATPPLQIHIAIKLLFQWVGTHWYQLKTVWEMLLGFVTARVTVNDRSGSDDIALFEKGKDNIFGEDRIYCEFALRSLYNISQLLKDSNLNEDFIRCLSECLEEEIHSLPEINQTKSLDSLFINDTLLFKRISGIFSLIRLLGRIGRKVSEHEKILQITAHSYMLSLSLREIEEWIQET